MCFVEHDDPERHLRKRAALALIVTFDDKPSRNMGGPNVPLGIEDSILGAVDAIVSQAEKSRLRVLDRVRREVPR